MLATVGRGYAIAHVRGVNLHGYAGWITWLAVHFLYLTGFQNRALVPIPVGVGIHHLPAWGTCHPR